jgi:hypothetical protein
MSGPVTWNLIIPTYPLNLHFLDKSCALSQEPGGVFSRFVAGKVFGKEIGL